MKSRQEELSEIQLLKTYHTAKDYRQDNKDNNDNMISYHDKKTWHAIILTDESTSE